MKQWLFLRGLRQEQAHWGDFLLRCQQQLGWQCYALDLPGTGSEHQRPSASSIAAIRKDLQQRLPALNIRQPFGIVAMSLGGMVALDWAASSPSQVSKLILINSSDRSAKFYQRLRPRVLPKFFRALFAPDLYQREKNIITMISNYRHCDKVLIQNWTNIQTLRPVKPLVIVNQLRAAGKFKMPSLSPDIEGLIITSLADQMVSSRCSHYLASHLGFPLVEHKSAGHDLVLDDSDWLIEQMRAFIAADKAECLHSIQ